ncbi:MAG: DNA polymerase I, partial [Deltaproteobacteria bacterium]|nr:DNA polymerase I [Deltaproteobacteria bacterium]
MSHDGTLYLIDGTAYIYRAYHAIRSLTNSSGLPTNAVFGFSRMLIKLINEHNPEYAAMFFDAKGPTFRHEIYDAYKANRPPMPEDMAVQIPYIRKVTRGFRFPIYEMQGFEADDLMGTIARLAEADGFKVVMVTGDKDFMQLVTPRTTIYDPMKDKITDEKAVLDRFGVEPARITDIMGLWGDASDNIPGVPGIGEKTAVSLVNQFGMLEQIYENVETIPRKKQKENLLNHRDQAFLSRQLATINREVPVSYDPDGFRLQDPDRPALASLFKEMEFSQLQQSVADASANREKTYHPITDPVTLEKLVDRLAGANRFALDTETTAKDPMQARLVGVSVSLTPDEAYYIPCGHDAAAAPQQIPCSEVLARLKPVFENPDIQKIGQNIKYDWIVLKRHGVDLAGVAFDTMLASYLINPAKRAHNLAQIALDYLDHRMTTYQDVTGKGKSAVGFEQVPLDQASPYACEDADITLSAHGVLASRIEAAGLTQLMETVEIPLIPVLMRMEMAGIGVNRNRLAALSKDFEHQLTGIESDIYAIAGETFNIRSSQQLGKILFEKLNLPVQKKTKKKTGYSTDMDVLTTLAGRHELPARVLRHRTLSKLKSTYTDALLELIHPDTGRIHTSYNQTVTATGRLSSSDPNLQNIPIRTEEGRQIRSAFVPRKGWRLLASDYSQIELRILAHCSEDPILIEAFQADEDIHLRTATEVFQVFPSFINDELRRQAKAINFGIIYGMSAFGLSKQLDISQKMAQTYIDNYFSRYKGVKQFMAETIQVAQKTRQTTTLLNRIRPLPDIDSR